MVGESPTTGSKGQAVETAHTLPEVEKTSDFLGFVAEPWATIVPMVGQTRLVSLSQAPQVRSDLPFKKRIPGRPTPFQRDIGDQIPFLPPNPAPKTTPADLDSVNEYRSEAWTKGMIKAGVARQGLKKFLQQVDRARAYLRGSGFWRLRSGDDLKPKQEGYLVSWLRQQAEEHPDGKRNGLIDEMALFVAVELEGLIVFPPAPGGWAVTR
jgi:hypothetical protein